MKVAVIVLAIVALGSSAPQPRTAFHEHFEDFIEVILEESVDAFEQLVNEYLQFEEFVQTLEFMITNNYKDLIYEMESLPEFVAVLEFLENDNIDVYYFVDFFNEMLEEATTRRRHQLRVASGRDMSSFITDALSLFPKDKLAALFEQKKAESEEFRVAVENLQSEEWARVTGALWESEAFQKEVETLAENGIDVKNWFTVVKAIFGQD